jgi:hypothetical protein
LKISTYKTENYPKTRGTLRNAYPFWKPLGIIFFNVIFTVADRKQDEELDELSLSVQRIGGVGLTIHEELLGQVGLRYLCPMIIFSLYIDLNSRLGNNYVVMCFPQVSSIEVVLSLLILLLTEFSF